MGLGIDFYYQPMMRFLSVDNRNMPVEAGAGRSVVPVFVAAIRSVAGADTLSQVMARLAVTTR